MSSSVLEPVKNLTLPSDQDASGRTLGEDEIAMVVEAINSGVLTSTKGKFTRAFETRIAEMLGVRHAFACASGSAAVHIAVAAIDPEPGDEIITTPITDMGALTPILYQGAIPVFADVDPRTLNVTAATIAARISPRTRAIIVTHLFGNPCDMTEILALAEQHGIPVIEDSAQAFMARHNGALAGGIGAIGAFSLQQGKHITTGEGGIVTTNDDALARRMFLLINKAWGYGDAQPDHYFIALNYRISELQGAVALAQLDKLDFSVRARQAAAAQLTQMLTQRLTQMLAGADGLETPHVDARDEHVYWKYCLRVDGAAIRGGAVGLAAKLKERGIFSAPRYIQKPAFMCEIFQKQRTFGNSRWPFTLARPEAVDYRRELFPGSFAGLEAVLVLPWNEHYTSEHVTYIADSIGEAVAALRQ
ncbi:MAG: DegT/DnrJ/EryC1/StrS family aminotransferase [Blastocatellia bacterium]